MTLTTDQFIRRFLSHVLPKGFHRIRHYGLLANGNRAANLARTFSVSLTTEKRKVSSGTQGNGATGI